MPGIERAGIDVRLGCKVTEVREGDSGVSVSWESAEGPQSETVAGVVNALPAIFTADIMSDLSNAQRDFLNTVPYTSNVNVNLGLSRPPEGHKSFVIQIPKSVQPDLFAIVLDHNKAPGRTPPGKGMASLYAMSNWSEKLLEMDDETALAEMIKAGERLIPELGSLVEVSNINRWYPVVVYSYPGFYKKRGISSIILEADQRLGGRIKTVRLDGCAFDVGAIGLLGSYKTTAALIQDIGLGDKLSKESVCLAIPRDGQLHQLDMAKPLSILKTGLLSTGSLLKAAKLAGPMIRHWKNLQFESISPMQALDRESVEAYTRRELNGELYDFLMSPVIRALWQRDAETAPLIDLFWSLKAFAPSMYALSGGMDLLTEGLAQRAHCVTGAVVEAVEDGPAGAKVSYVHQGQARTEHFRACIMAVPSTVTAKLLRPLPAGMAVALNQLPYSCSVNVHLSLNKPIGGKTQILFPPESESADLTTVVFEHNKGPGRAPAGGGALSLFWRDSWSRPRLEADDDTILKEAVREADKLIPDFDPAQVVGSHIERWHFSGVCREIGGSRAVKEIETARQRLKSVTLAGDYYALSGVNAAVISGQRAAREIRF